MIASVDEGGIKIVSQTTENWSVGNNGAEMIFQTRPNGSDTVATRMIIQQAGGVLLPNLKSGAAQVAHGATIDELWITSGHIYIARQRIDDYKSNVF